ncbi:MAG TPA: LysR family transcriptional regulator [Rhodoblastus sp.]|nr:LysR family transcriptional regulator [Rhodoblastus sp.]
MEKGSRFDLNLLEIFAAVFRERSITRAAGALNLSQPTVSHALARLRDLLNDPLFVRDGHLMAPTPLAVRLSEPVGAGLTLLDSALNQLHAFDPQTSQRRFSIGLRHTIESAVLPAIAERLRLDAPRISIASVHHDRKQIESQLANGELDVAIDVRTPASAALIFRRLMGGDYVVAVRRGHPALRDKLDLETYLALDHVAASSRSAGLNIEDMALQEMGRSRRVVVRCQNLWTASQLAARSDLALTLPRRFASSVCQPDQQDLHPFPAPHQKTHIFLYWHSKFDGEASNLWLRERIVAAVGL